MPHSPGAAADLSGGDPPVRAREAALPHPVPIRIIHDRWIDKYTEAPASMLVDLKAKLEGKQ